MSESNEVLVNVEQWDGPPLDGPLFGDGWVLVNAPRPLAGPVTWTGHFRHGTFYATGPGPGTEDGDRLAKLWAADDAWPVVFTTNAAIEEAVLAKFAEYGYGSAEEAGVTIAEQAACMQLPYVEH
jgi:hypothetical protein